MGMFLNAAHHQCASYAPMPGLGVRAPLCDVMGTF